MAGSQGIHERHAKSCKSIEGGRCNCSPSYMAHVWDNRAGKRIYKTCRTKTEAKQWRHDALAALRAGTLAAPTRQTVQQAGDDLIAGMRTGAILDRSGKPYKPATLRSYERALRLRIYPVFGSRRVGDVARGDVQAFVERLNAEGLKPRTVLNTLDPLRVVMRRAVRAGERTTDPTDGLELPRVRGRRERVATREQATALITAVPEQDRAFWACAFYAGLRRGELRALRWSDVDLAATPAVIHVRRTWDDHEGEVETKSEAGVRTVPMTRVLHDLMVLHGLATARAADDLVFGRTARDPFTPTTIRNRALKAWKAAGLEDVKLSPHEARHTAASFFVDMGLNDVQLTAKIGHSDPRTTKLIYAHLFPDADEQIAAKMDAYFQESEA